MIVLMVHRLYPLTVNLVKSTRVGKITTIGSAPVSLTEFTNFGISFSVILKLRNLGCKNHSYKNPRIVKN